MDDKRIIFASLLLENYIQIEWESIVGHPDAQNCTLIKCRNHSATPWIWPLVKDKVDVLNHIAPRSTILKCIVATKFDFLSFFRFYGSFLAGIYLEVAMDVSLDQDIFWQRYLSFNPLKTGPSFTLSRPERDLGDLLNSKLDYGRQRSLRDFRRSFQQIIVASQELVAANPNVPKVWYIHWKEAKSISDLPPAHIKFFESVYSMIANFFVHVFGAKNLYIRFKKIMSKVPVSFILTGVYFFDPSPFIARCLDMFLWKPTANVPSLCQRLAGVVCDHEQTHNKFKSISAKISAHRMQAIDSALEQSGPSSRDIEGIRASISFLQPSDIEQSYAQTRVRLQEKTAFIACFSGKSKSDFLTYLGENLPILLAEVKKGISLHTLLTNFFQFLTELEVNLGKLLPYDHPDYAQVKDEVIEDITNDFAKFLESFYPCLHYIGKVHGTDNELPLFTTMFDYLLGTAFTMNHTPEEMKNYASEYLDKLDEMVASLNSDKQQEYDDLIENIIKLDKNGYDERYWPPSELLDQFCGEK